MKRECLAKMISLDTNYLLRFLTNDIKSQALIAKKLITGSEDIYISTIALAETVYFLRNHYKKTKAEICEEMSLFIKQPNIKTPEFILPAISIYRSENIGIYDSLLIAEALNKKLKFKTFDKKLSKVFKKYLS